MEIDMTVFGSGCGIVLLGLFAGIAVGLAFRTLKEVGR